MGISLWQLVILVVVVVLVLPFVFRTKRMGIRRREDPPDD